MRLRRLHIKKKDSTWPPQHRRKQNILLISSRPTALYYITIYTELIEKFFVYAFLLHRAKFSWKLCISHITSYGCSSCLLRTYKSRRSSRPIHTLSDLYCTRGTMWAVRYGASDCNCLEYKQKRVLLRQCTISHLCIFMDAVTLYCCVYVS